MSSRSSSTASALRLGWLVAEVRGRNWPYGPRPTATALPPHPDDVLPLRSQREGSASRGEAAKALVALASRLDLDPEHSLEGDLLAVLPPFDAEGDASLVDDGGPVGREAWRERADFFLTWDCRFQDLLAQRDEALANAYLLGRGLAECFWGLGPQRAWLVDGVPTAVSPAFLFGPERRLELTRMLGRLEQGDLHPMTSAAIAGSLEAWGAVARDPAWWEAPDLRERLYEQVRRWYQLLLLGQDPTTLIPPGAKLHGMRGVRRAARVFWPAIALVLAAVVLITTFIAVAGTSGVSWVTSLLATSGIGAVLGAGAFAKGQSAAQRLVTRMRQDTYTDLVAVSVTSRPRRPEVAGAGRAPSERRARRELEGVVRQRSLTTATRPPTD